MANSRLEAAHVPDQLAVELGVDIGRHREVIQGSEMPARVSAIRRTHRVRSVPSCLADGVLCSKTSRSFRGVELESASYPQTGEVKKVPLASAFMFTPE